MTRIELGGALGKVFGRTHDRLIRTTAEAINALSKTICGFEQYLNTSKNRGLTYAVFKGKRNIGKDDLGFPVTGEVIRIIPVVIGSKKAGLLQTVLGAVLVVVGAFYYRPSVGRCSLGPCRYENRRCNDAWWCCSNAFATASRTCQQTRCRQPGFVCVRRSNQYSGAGISRPPRVW